MECFLRKSPVFVLSFTLHLLCAVLLFTAHAHCESNEMSQSIWKQVIVYAAKPTSYDKEKQTADRCWCLVKIVFDLHFQVISFSIKITLAEIRTQIWIKFEWLVVLIGYIHTARKCDQTPTFSVVWTAQTTCNLIVLALVQTISPYLICVHIHLPLCGEFDWHSIWPIIMQNPPFLSDKQAWQETGH